MASIDALFTDVYEVQKELEKFGAKRLVDACDIFKLLDTHSLRSDRVQFVTTHLLVRLGLRSNFGEEDIINVPDVLNDPDVSHAVAIPTYQNDNFICDDSDSSSTCSMSSFSSPSSVAGDASKNESYIVLNTNVQGSNTKQNLGPNNSHAVSIPTNQNDNFICDVNKNCPNNNIEYQVPVQAEDKQEQLDSAFEDHPEPQPSSSKMNRKAFKRNNVYPFTSRNTKVSKLESAFNKKCQMKVQQGKVSKSYLSVGTPSKECNTSYVAEKVQLIDRAIKSNSSATDTKQPDIWKESSTSTSNASAEWNIVYMTGITGGIEIASTANDNTQTKPIVVSDDFGLKTDTSESSRPGWEVAKPGTSQADVQAGVNVPFLQEDTRHATVKKYKCNVCNKSFSDRSNLRKHQRIHTGHRPYSCNQCPKVYGDRTALKQHLRMHSGDRPYTCNECKKGLFSKFNLKQHYERVHNLFK